MNIHYGDGCENFRANKGWITMVGEKRHEVCASVVDWANKFSNVYPELKSLIYIPNVADVPAASPSARKWASDFFDMITPGVPDFMLPIPVGIYAGLFIVVSPNETGWLSDLEYKWMDDLHTRGYYVRVCHDAADAIFSIKTYLRDVV